MKIPRNYSSGCCMVCGHNRMRRVFDYLVCDKCKNRQDKACPSEGAIERIAERLRKAKGEEARTDLR